MLLWKTLEDMRQDKPLCRSHDFVDRSMPLNAWLSITDAIERERTFTSYGGLENDELDITKSPVNTFQTLNLLPQPYQGGEKIFDEDNKSK